MQTKCGPRLMQDVDEKHNPSRSSYYVTDAFYRDLVEGFADWQRDDLAISDAAERDRFRALIERDIQLGAARIRRKIDEFVAGVGGNLEMRKSRVCIASRGPTTPCARA